MYPDTKWSELAPTIQYNKFGISGNHLMFVLAGYVDLNTYPNGVEINAGCELAGRIPSWVASKLYPWFKNAGGGALVGLSVADMLYEANDIGGLVEKTAFRLYKWGAENIHMQSQNTFTIKGGYRIQFDFIVE